MDLVSLQDRLTTGESKRHKCADGSAGKTIHHVLKNDRTECLQGLNAQCPVALVPEALLETLPHASAATIAPEALSLLSLLEVLSPVSF